MAQKKKESHRIVMMGATISLPSYSSLRIDVAENIEGEGLDMQKTALYLKSLAKKVGGTLALPALDGEEKKEVKKEAQPKVMQSDFFGRPMQYDEVAHSYTVNGNNFISATTLVDQFYPIHNSGFIANEYLENAAAYGSFVHKVLENALKGYCSRKESIQKLQQQVVDYVAQDKENGAKVFTEQMIFDTDYNVAGRFDALVGTKLIDWKTNNDLFGKKECLIPEDVLAKIDEYCNWNTIWGSYVLQQNLYAYMLNKIQAGTVENSVIAWAPDMNCELKFFDVPLMQASEVEVLLNYYKSIQ